MPDDDKKEDSELTIKTNYSPEIKPSNPIQIPNPNPMLQPGILVGLQYTSPLPPPNILEQYRKLGLLEEVVAQTKVQSEHRRELENTKLNAEIKNTNDKVTLAFRGQWMSYTIVLLGLGGCVTMGLLNHPGVATALAAIGFTGIANALMNMFNKNKPE